MLNVTQLALMHSVVRPSVHSTAEPGFIPDDPYKYCFDSIFKKVVFWSYLTRLMYVGMLKSFAF